MKNRKLILKELFSNDEVSGEWGEELPSETHLLRVRCIRGADIEEAWLNKLHSAPTRYIKNKSISKLLKENDIILEISGGSPTQSTGRAVIITRQLLQHAKDPIVCSNFCRTLRVNNQNDPKYVFYSLQNIYRQGVFFNFEGKTTGIKNLDLKSALKSIPIIYLDFPTQQKLAAVLSALDTKIELNQRINAELESMAKTLYDYWFVQFDFPNEKGKPYKSAGGKMVWNEALKREIPLGWEVGTLLDIADFMNGLPCQKFRPTGSESLRVIKIREMHEGFSENSELTRPDIPQKAIIENGDVLFSWSASLEVQIWSGGKGALNQHIFKVTSDKYPKSFYYYQLINYLTHFKMMSENRKTTMGHITQEHLQQSRIALPTKHLTLKLEKIIDPIFKRKTVNEIDSQTLTELRDWLLPMLMNGQVRVMG